MQIKKTTKNWEKSLDWLMQIGKISIVFANFIPLAITIINYLENNTQWK